ncbi:MAG: hypothetical protein NTW33_07655 [Methanoregula sp.]|nr:hypothetical protein [Methanoregula sp.]
MQGVRGWAVENLVIIPGEGPVSPLTPMTVTYTVHIASFTSKNTLDMYTDLSNATWVVTKTDIVEDHPAVTSPLQEKIGSRVRIDGWLLSYSRGRQIELNVQLKGTAPDVAQTQDKTIIRVQEWTSDAQPLTDTGISKKYQIFVPTPTPETPPPTLTQAPTEIVPDQNTPVTSATPTIKQTYSPGPGPVLVCGMLAVLVMFMAVKKKK